MNFGAGDLHRLGAV